MAWHRAVEQGAVVGRPLRCRVGPVGQQGELDALSPDWRGSAAAGRAPARGPTRLRQHRRDDDHRPVLGRDAGRESEPRQAARPRRLADQPVDHRDHRLRTPAGKSISAPPAAVSHGTRRAGKPCAVAQQQSRRRCRASPARSRRGRWAARPGAAAAAGAGAFVAGRPSAGSSAGWPGAAQPVAGDHARRRR